MTESLILLTCCPPLPTDGLSANSNILNLAGLVSITFLKYAFSKLRMIVLLTENTTSRSDFLNYKNLHDVCWVTKISKTLVIYDFFEK